MPVLHVHLYLPRSAGDVGEIGRSLGPVSRVADQVDRRRTHCTDYRADRQDTHAARDRSRTELMHTPVEQSAPSERDEEEENRQPEERADAARASASSPTGGILASGLPGLDLLFQTSITSRGPRWSRVAVRSRIVVVVTSSESFIGKPLTGILRVVVLAGPYLRARARMVTREKRTSSRGTRSTRPIGQIARIRVARQVGMLLGAKQRPLRPGVILETSTPRDRAPTRVRGYREPRSFRLAA